MLLVLLLSINGFFVYSRTFTLWCLSIHIYIYMPDCLLHVCTEPLIALKLDNYHYQIARVEYIFTLRWRGKYIIDCRSCTYSVWTPDLYILFDVSCRISPRCTMRHWWWICGSWAMMIHVLSSICTITIRQFVVHGSMIDGLFTPLFYETVCCLVDGFGTLCDCIVFHFRNISRCGCTSCVHIMRAPRAHTRLS